MKVSFKNKNLENVEVCFEPEGLTLPLSNDEMIDLHVSIDDAALASGGLPFKIEIDKQDGKIYVIFWEEYQCRYQVSFKGKIVKE